MEKKIRLKKEFSILFWRKSGEKYTYLTYSHSFTQSISSKHAKTHKHIHEYTYANYESIFSDFNSL